MLGNFKNIVEKTHCLLQRIPVHVMISRLHSSNMCPASLTEDADKGILFGLFSRFKEHSCIHLDSCSIYFNAFMTRYGHIRQEELEQVLKSEEVKGSVHASQSSPLKYKIKRNLETMSLN